MNASKDRFSLQQVSVHQKDRILYGTHFVCSPTVHCTIQISFEYARPLLACLWQLHMHPYSCLHFFVHVL